MESLDDVVARDRRSQDLAVRAAGEPERTYTYHRFCTTAWKTGNFLRHLGVGDGVAVGVAADPLPQSLLTFFGTALLGGRTRFAPPTEFDGRAVVARSDAVDRYELPAGGQRVGYGDDPEDPATRYFEEEVWSENPSFPPVERDPSTPALDDGERIYSHADLLDAAADVISAFDLDADDAVAVRASLADPRTVVAGALAPLVAGGTVLFPAAEDRTGATDAAASASGDVAVVPTTERGAAPESRTITLDDVTV
ncbi:AMP-binding enzyme [Natronoarchaeum philippinense]|uniref:AMP-binding enzyme n=1 Tax=Natronoarchaeum philippinense TaxID=558529 RepID=A0A285N620_NATPI|nr:AMP-binding protein [Natronoarchaeum philippinense]SNZ04925.1 AMP-binding enzyme [Natronoarchaeum philippinense]